MRLNPRYLFLLAAAALCPAAGAVPSAVSPGETIPWVGSRGITESVSAIMARRTASEGWVPRERYRPLRANRLALRQAAASGATDLRTPARQGHDGGPKAPQTAGLSFDGAQVSEAQGYLPPDAMGAAGPSQFLVTVNGLIRTFNKSTGVKDGALDVNLDTFFQSVTTPAFLGSGVTDPHCRYDRLSGRWFIVCIDLATTNNRVLIAVSSGSTISSTSSFTFFYFQQNTVSPAGDTNYFGDFPTLGLDNNALYIGLNMFTGSNSFRGSSGFVVRKSSILGAGPIVATAFRGLCTATDTVLNPGPYTPQGVDNDDPAAAEGYFIGVDNAAYSLLVVRRISNPGGTPTVSANLNIMVPPTAYPPTVPLLGSTCPLDASEDRLFAAQMNQDPNTGVRTLWTAHNIGVTATGAASDTPTRAATRWYEIKNLATTPALAQSGTLYDSAAANARSYIYPTVAMSGQGHVALTCSTGGAAEKTGIALTGRLYGDASGTLRPVTMAALDANTYNAQTCNTSTTSQRWGDYSFTSVDPDDDMTMWTVQEYCNALNSWAVRVIRLLAPPPAVPASCNPASLAAGASNVNVILTGTSANGSGFFDPGAGFRNHIAASFSGAGITVNSVSYTNPTQITLNISIAAGAATGARTVTVTNPDGQAAASATGIFAIGGIPYTIADATTALKIAGGLIGSTPADAIRLDAAGSGRVNVADATLILRKVLGLSTNP